MERFRWLALGIGLAAYAFVAWYFVFRGTTPPPSEELRLVQRAIYAADQWAFIVAACGFARRHLHRDSAARALPHRRDLPVLHRPPDGDHPLRGMAARAGPSAPLEALVLIALVALACFATYEVVKRIGVLRPALRPEAGAPATR
jgi:hypothetical protein